MQPREAMKKFCSLLGTCSPELGPWMEAQQKEKEEKERLRKEEEERLRREAEEAAERERQRLLAEEMRRKAEEEERYNKTVFVFEIFICNLHGKSFVLKPPPPPPPIPNPPIYRISSYIIKVGILRLCSP